MMTITNYPYKFKKFKYYKTLLHFMESSTTFPTIFDPKYEKSAELIAYLTKGIAYRDNGDIRVAGRSELNKIIAEKYEQKDFIGANEILEAAKRTFEITSEELAERVSRSIRVPTPTYLKLVEIASKKEVSLASVMRTVVLGPVIRSALDELSSRPEVAPDRLSRVEAVFEDWIEPESAKIGSYSLSFEYEDSFRVYKLLTKFIEFVFFAKCSYWNAPKQASDLFWTSIWEEPPYSSHDYLVNIIETNDIHISSLKGEHLSMYYDLTLTNDFINDSLYDIAIKNIKEQFGPKTLDKIVTAASHRWVYSFWHLESEPEPPEEGTEEFFREFGYKEGKQVDFVTENSISCILSVNGNRVYLDDIEICLENRNKIARNILLKMYPKVYDEHEIQNRIQDAIGSDDLDGASKLSRSLAEYRVCVGVAEWITDSIFSAIETSEVITFTIPPIFIPILNSLQENKQIPDLVERYLQKEQ